MIAAWYPKQFWYNAQTYFCLIYMFYEQSKTAQSIKRESFTLLHIKSCFSIIDIHINTFASMLAIAICTILEFYSVLMENFEFYFLVISIEQYIGLVYSSKSKIPMQCIAVRVLLPSLSLNMFQIEICLQQTQYQSQMNTKYTLHSLLTKGYKTNCMLL